MPQSTKVSSESFLPGCTRKRLYGKKPAFGMQHKTITIEHTLACKKKVESSLPRGSLFYEGRGNFINVLEHILVQ